MVGISDKADKYPDELSAGEQQRVAIARAIINNPTVLIADEPTGNLDPDTATEIMDLLNQINITGTTIVMVTHAKDIVDRMQKRVIAIENGHIVRDEFGQYGFEEEHPAEEPAFEEIEMSEYIERFGLSEQFMLVGNDQAEQPEEVEPDEQNEPPKQAELSEAAEPPEQAESSEAAEQQEQTELPEAAEPPEQAELPEQSEEEVLTDEQN